MLALEDTNYHGVRDALAMDSSKDYLSCLSAIDQHATMFVGAKNLKTTGTSTATKAAKKVTEKSTAQDRKKTKEIKEELQVQHQNNQKSQSELMTISGKTCQEQ